MKPKAPASAVLEDSASPTVASNTALSPKLKELQGSFALEGIVIPDERLLQYAAEFEGAKRRGKVDAKIEKALRQIS